MNYIELINHYWQLREQGIVSGAEGDLYMYLLHISNKLGWKNPFNQSNRLICAYLNMSEKSLIKYKNVLKQVGLIDFEAGKAVKQNSSYTLLLLDGWNNYSSPGSRSDSRPGSGSGSSQATDCNNYSSPGGSSGSSSDSRPGSSSGSGSGKNRSDYNKLNTKQNNTLSLSPGTEEREKEKERILFLEYLFFEKRILTPADEAARFMAHYEKTDWKDANGNRITNKLAALKGWKVADGLPAVPKSFAEKWREIYEAAKGESTKSVLMITDFFGYKTAENCLKISVTKSLYTFLDDPDTIEAIKPAFRQVFPGLKLEYLVTKK